MLKANKKSYLAAVFTPVADWCPCWWWSKWLRPSTPTCLFLLENNEQKTIKTTWVVIHFNLPSCYVKPFRKKQTKMQLHAQKLLPYKNRIIDYMNSLHHSID